MANAVEFEFQKPLKFFDLDPKALKPHWRQIGRQINKTIKRELNNRGVSRPGQAPGRRTGKLGKSSKYTVTKRGFSLFIFPKKVDENFYAPYVIYGHVAPNRAGSGDNKVAQPRLNVWDKVVTEYGIKEFPDKAKEMVVDAIKEGII